MKLTLAEVLIAAWPSDRVAKAFQESVEGPVSTELETQAFYAREIRRRIAKNPFLGGVKFAASYQLLETLKPKI